MFGDVHVAVCFVIPVLLIMWNEWLPVKLRYRSQLLQC